MEDKPRCRWCRRVLAPQHGPGRRREFCNQACRQWDWVARQRANELELSENELIIARDQIDELHDDIYVLRCAIDDARNDLAAAGNRPTVRELTDIISWLLDAAEPVCTRQLRAAGAEA